jgi:hypothetical protein
MVVIPKTVEFQPGNGTRYEVTMVDDPHGGILVVWPRHSTYRWFPGNGEFFHLHGKQNIYDQQAIKEFLNKGFESGF